MSMSAAEQDISAVLDDVEMENLVSLLQDDTVFDDLKQLDLTALDIAQNGHVYVNDGSNDIEFHDALEYFSDTASFHTGNPYSGTTLTPFRDYQLNSVAGIHSNTKLTDEILNELFLTNHNTSEFIGNPVTCTMETLTTIPSPQPDLAARQALVRHDHTYSCATLSKDPVHSSSMLTCLENGGKNSDNEEESGSDTGYDTTTTSPDSARSSFSSPKEFIPRASVLPELPPTNPDLSQLVMDPVKLIDERIKFFMSHQEVHLTDEEKDTLRSEGLPIPTTLPLTKTEEKALKSVRRKIRNKIAAQESRKKKKEYMHCLEEQVQQCTKENRKLHKKVETLETKNKTLLQQLAHLQALVARANPILGRQVNMGTCLMVVVLCFGVLFGNLIPYRVSVATANDYTTSAVRSRSLLSIDTATKWSGWMDVYKNLLSGNAIDIKANKPSVKDSYAGGRMNSLLVHCDGNATLLKH